jgi:hypothetical protein
VFHVRHCGIPDNTVVSDGAHLLVPFASARPEAPPDLLRELRLPHLGKLVARLGLEGTDAGDPHSLSAPHERALAQAHGLPAEDGLIPLAAAQVRQSGRDAGAEAWAWITPAHWRVGHDLIAMAAPQDLRLDEAESRALLEALRPWLAEDGITLEYEAPLRWLARGEVFRGLRSASLDRVIGRDIESWMPTGDAGRLVRRLQQEMQMLLYTLPLNDARESRGLPPVNSFWVSGTGALAAEAPLRRPVGLQVASALREPALQRDWQAWAAAWRQLDAQEGARLLAEAESGQPVRLTLCGEASSRTWSSAGASAWRRIAGRFAGASIPSLLEGL